MIIDNEQSRINNPDRGEMIVESYDLFKISNGRAYLQRQSDGSPGYKPVRKMRPARSITLCIQNSAELHTEIPGPSPGPSGMYKQYTYPEGRSLPNREDRTSAGIACRHTSTWPE